MSPDMNWRSFFIWVSFPAVLRGGTTNGSGSPSLVRGVQLPRVGNALERVGAPVGELDPRPGHEILDGPRNEPLARPRERADARRDVNGDAADVVPHHLALPRVQACANTDSQLLRGVEDRPGAMDRPCRTVKRGQEPVPDRFDLASVKAP